MGRANAVPKGSAARIDKYRRKNPKYRFAEPVTVLETFDGFFVTSARGRSFRTTVGSRTQARRRYVTIVFRYTYGRHGGLPLRTMDRGKNPYSHRKRLSYR